MSEQIQTPLVGPPIRRGWREIVRFRPLTSTAHVALVVTRRGRVTSVVSANGPRTLSDYVSWPYDYREVDTRERLLVLDQRIGSGDAGYDFAVAARVVYQIAQPDRVARGLDDPLAELEHAIVQSLRQTAPAFGVEQSQALEEHLVELLLRGDKLGQRAAALGFALCRADVMVALDDRARTFAEDLRRHMHERPLHLQLAIESIEPDRNFDVLVGGFYRMTDRAMGGTHAAAETAIQQAVARTLRRVGITFAPHDYAAAARAMAEALRKDSIVQAEMSVAHAQLLRPTVQIQPDRGMVQALQASAPVTPEPQAAAPRYPRQRRGAEQPFAPPDHDEAPPWAGLAAAVREPPAPIEQSPAPPPAWLAAESAVDDAPPAPDDALAALSDRWDEQPATPAAPPGAGVTPVPVSSDDEVLEENLADSQPPALEQEPADGSAIPADGGTYGSEADEGGFWRAPLDWMPAGTIDMALPDLLAPEEAPSPEGLDARIEPAAPPASADSRPATPPDAETARFIALLHTQGPAWFKMWSLELQEQPERLPEILSEVTVDPIVLVLADDPRRQEALVRALQAAPAQLAALGAQPVKPAAQASDPAAERPADGVDTPDWLGLRQKWNDGGGA